MDKWHLDEVLLKINGETHYLWRVGDQHDNVLDILVTSKRDKHSAKHFFRKLVKVCRTCPEPSSLTSGVAKREIMPSVEHRQHKGLNNRAENSH